MREVVVVLPTSHIIDYTLPSARTLCGIDLTFSGALTFEPSPVDKAISTITCKFCTNTLMKKLIEDAHG